MSRIARCQESFDRKVVRIVRVEETIRLDAQVSPENSVSRNGSQSTSKFSQRSEHLSHKSSGSSLSVLRAKAAGCTAELKVEASILGKRHFLEEQSFCLKQEEKRLT